MQAKRTGKREEEISRDYLLASNLTIRQSDQVLSELQRCLIVYRRCTRAGSLLQILLRMEQGKGFLEGQEQLKLIPGNAFFQRYPLRHLGSTGWSPTSAQRS